MWQAPEMYQTIAWRRRTDGDPLLPIYKESAKSLFEWKGETFTSHMLVLNPASHLEGKAYEYFHEGSIE